MLIKVNCVFSPAPRAYTLLKKPNVTQAQNMYGTQNAAIQVDRAAQLANLC
jgi:hypothetical protein